MCHQRLQEVKRTEMEEAAVAEKKEWLKEEDESELLQVSIALPQVPWQVLGGFTAHYTLCCVLESALFFW